MTPKYSYSAHVFVLRLSYIFIENKNFTKIFIKICHLPLLLQYIENFIFPTSAQDRNIFPKIFVFFPQFSQLFLKILIIVMHFLKIFSTFTYMGTGWFGSWHPWRVRKEASPARRLINCNRKINYRQIYTTNFGPDTPYLSHTHGRSSLPFHGCV